MRCHPPNKIRQTITARAGVLASNNCAYKSKEFERTKDCCALTPGDMSEQLQSNNMKTKTEKNHPRVGSRAEWLAARLELLKAEKELTRHSDELARQRQELPWVRIEKEYRFETDEGSASLADLFRGRSQLVPRSPRSSNTRGAPNTTTGARRRGRLPRYPRGRHPK